MGITVLPWNEQNFYKLWERKGREHKEKISIKKGQGIWARDWSIDFLFWIYQWEGTRQDIGEAGYREPSLRCLVLS